MVYGTPRIERMRLSDVARLPGNPRTHDIGVLTISHETFGFVRPLLYDEAEGVLAAGHGNLEALLLRKKEGLPPPRGVEDDGEDWTVAVIRGLSFENAAERMAYAIVDNRSVELGGWDDLALATALTEVAEADESGALLTASGYDGDELDGMLRDLGIKFSGESGTGVASGDDLVGRASEKTWGITIRCKDQHEEDRLVAFLEEQGWHVARFSDR